MPGVRQGLQPELQPDNPLPQAHRLQALLLQALPQVLPAQGGPAAPQGDPAHGPARPPGQGGLHVGGGSGGGICRAQCSGGGSRRRRGVPGQPGTTTASERRTPDGRPQLSEGVAAGITGAAAAGSRDPNQPQSMCNRWSSLCRGLKQFQRTRN